MAIRQTISVVVSIKQNYDVVASHTLTSTLEADADDIGSMVADRVRLLRHQVEKFSATPLAERSSTTE